MCCSDVRGQCYRLRYTVQNIKTHGTHTEEPNDCFSSLFPGLTRWQFHISFLVLLFLFSIVFLCPVLTVNTAGFFCVQKCQLTSWVLKLCPKDGCSFSSLASPLLPQELQMINLARGQAALAPLRDHHQRSRVWVLHLLVQLSRTVRSVFCV